MVELQFVHLFGRQWIWIFLWTLPLPDGFHHGKNPLVFLPQLPLVPNLHLHLLSPLLHYLLRPLLHHRLLPQSHPRVPQLRVKRQTQTGRRRLFGALGQKCGSTKDTSTSATSSNWECSTWGRTNFTSDYYFIYTSMQCAMPSMWQTLLKASPPLSVKLDNWILDYQNLKVVMSNKVVLKKA